MTLPGADMMYAPWTLQLGVLSSTQMSLWPALSPKAIQKLSNYSEVLSLLMSQEDKMQNACTAEWEHVLVLGHSLP